MKLADLIARLDQDFAAIAIAALAENTDRLANNVRTALSTPPGGPHDHPWLQTGALRDSIETSCDGPETVVASTSQTALFQEHGTARMPPRPTLAPLAAAEGESIAHNIADAMIRALGGV